MKPGRISISLLVASALISCAARAESFQVRNTDAKPWSAILGTIGITQDIHREPGVMVIGQDAQIDAAALAQNRIVILEGIGTSASNAGIVTKPESVRIRRISDIHAPGMPIIWEQPVEVPQVVLPDDFRTFAVEKWKNVPVLAGKRTAHGGILWLATAPGASGIERFPYLLQALNDLGYTPPAQSTTLWAFFDSSYRIRADPDYLAQRWRRAGIGALHIAAWHNMEPDPTQDGYLKQVIEACHRNAIAVYAWLELPHVSEKFWADHPAWREKTAVGQDAQLDWRKLMNLQNPDCRKAISELTGELLRDSTGTESICPSCISSLLKARRTQRASRP